MLVGKLNYAKRLKGQGGKRVFLCMVCQNIIQ